MSIKSNTVALRTTLQTTCFQEYCLSIKTLKFCTSAKSMPWLGIIFEDINSSVAALPFSK